MKIKVVKADKATTQYIEMANKYVNLRRLTAPLIREMEHIAKVLKEESNMKEFKGEDFTILIQNQVRLNVPQTIVLREMGEKWYKDHQVETKFKVLTFIDES